MSVPTSGAVGVEAVPAERATFFCGKLWFWLPIVPLVALDLVSKHLVFAFMAARRHVQYEVFDWADKVKFSLVEVTNKGTIWGLGQSLHLPLVVLRFFAIALIVFFASRTPRRHRTQLCVLGVILAGAIGNLWDNLTNPEPSLSGGGGVRDFLLFEFGAKGSAYQFPAFNVADSCITCGAILLAIMLLRQPSPPPADKALR